MSPPPGPLDSVWGAAKGVGGGVWDGVKSTAEGVADLAKGGYALATDPAAREQAWQTGKQVAQAAQNYAQQAYDDPAQAYQDAKDGANRLYSAFDKARQEAAAKGQSAEFWGHAAGRAAFEVGSLLVPVGAATKAGKLAEGARAAEKLAEGAKAATKAEAALAKAAKVADAGHEVLPCGKMVSESAADTIRAIPHGTRPAPSTYLSATQVESHLADFNEGAVRIQSWVPGETGIVPKDNNLFVLPKKDAMALIEKAEGDPRKLEKLLSIPENSLGDNPVLIDIPKPKGVRMATGNELSANSEWVPGGYTKGGIREAVIDSIAPTDYSVTPVFPPKGP